MFQGPDRENHVIVTFLVRRGNPPERRDKQEMHRGIAASKGPRSIDDDDDDVEQDD